MTDYIETVESGISYAQNTEIYLKRVLTGNVESVRLRLAHALERVGYDIVEDEPHVQGRRGTRGWGTWGASADVLDYGTTLTVKLKQVSANSTRATFDYVIKHPWLSRGEKGVVVSEAETIVALASNHRVDKLCGSCGTESTDDSRFCRRCGSPMTREQAELDVLRMTAEARAGHSSVVTSAVMLTITIVMLAAAMFAVAAGAISAKGLWALAIAGGVINLLNLLLTFCAWTRLNRALKTKSKDNQNLTAVHTQPLATGDPLALPHRQSYTSVTESTTELLTRKPMRATPLKPKAHDTDSIN